MSIKYLQTNYFCQASSAVTFTVQLQASSLPEAADYAMQLEGRIAEMNKPVEEIVPPPFTGSTREPAKTKKKATKKTIKYTFRKR